MDNMNKSFRKVLLFISLICIIALLTTGFMLLRQFDVINILRDQEEIPEEPRTEEEQRVIDELPDDLIYTLPRAATALQLALFEELFHTHDQFNQTGSDTDLIRYSSVIAQNFVADFFTLSNKTSRTNVGGLQFIADDILENFRDYALNNFYLYLNHHINTFGSESLPTVETIRIVNAEIGNHTLPLSEWPWSEYVPAIFVDLEWTYLRTTLPYINDFQSSARIILQENDGVVRIRAIMELPATDEDQNTIN